jgi:hypothetical protein
VLDAAPRILTSSEVFAEAFAEREALVEVTLPYSAAAPTVFPRTQAIALMR